MSPRGASRVFRLCDARLVLAAFVALLSVASAVQNQAARIEISGVAKQGTGQLDMQQGRVRLMRTLATAPEQQQQPQQQQQQQQPQLASQHAQRDTDVERETAEAASMVADAAREVEKEEALEAVVVAAQEVAKDKAKEEAAEDQLRSAAHMLDEVSSSSYLPMEPPKEAVESETILAQTSPSCSTCQCKFVDRQGMKHDCDSDFGLRLLVAKWLSPVSTVIEFGGAYGTTSCAIASQQQHSGKLVVVEPDHRMWVTLETNRMANKCNFTTVRGLLGHEDMKAVETDGVMKYDSLNGNTGNSATEIIIPHLTAGEVQSRYAMRFDTAVVNCDGCLHNLIIENSDLWTQLSMIIVGDQSKTEIEELKNLQNMGGFTEVEVINNYHVLRKNCGSIEACTSPQDKKQAQKPNPTLAYKDHVENLLSLR